MDKLIKYVNEKTEESGIEALYSTPSCYLKALYDDYVNIYPDFEWSTKDDDFFPYASGKYFIQLVVIKWPVGFVYDQFLNKNVHIRMPVVIKYDHRHKYPK